MDVVISWPLLDVPAGAQWGRAPRTASASPGGRSPGGTPGTSTPAPHHDRSRHGSAAREARDRRRWPSGHPSRAARRSPGRGRAPAASAGTRRRRGGTPLLAPCLREVPVDDRDILHDALREIAARRLDVAVFQTGVGAAAFLDAAEQAGCADAIRERLAAAVVVERGPKPLAVLLQNGIRVDRRTRDPHTTDEV